MTTYQLTDLRSVIKDGALHIPLDPDNTDFIEYLNWCNGGNKPDPAPSMSPLPDINSFIVDIKNAVGGIVGANALATAYPLFFSAVTSCEWDDVKTLIEDAEGKSIISNSQYEAIKTAALNNNIPISLA